jgi:uncharacterized membrane protein YhaH (DUF805 family)
MKILNAFFGFNGRLNRIQYAVVLIFGCLTPGILLIEWSESVADSVLFPTLCIVSWVLFASLAKRFHDINWSGSSCLSAVVPMIGTLVPIVMLFWRGTDGTNRFGAQQPSLF